MFARCASKKFEPLIIIKILTNKLENSEETCRLAPPGLSVYADDKKLAGTIYWQEKETVGTGSHFAPRKDPQDPVADVVVIFFADNASRRPQPGLFLPIFL